MDLTRTLGFDENFYQRMKIDILKQKVCIWDSDIGLKIDFVTNWILLCSARCTTSFMTLFAKNKKLTEEILSLSDISG